MTLSLLLACLWAFAANVLAMLPSRDNLWRRAYGLIAVGVPILGFVTWQNGPWVGLLVLAAGMSVLRWPVIYLGRWLRRLGRKPDADT
ncbi:Protein of unknown function [Roseovarius lutimaris]|uniref:DUF2484 family protein n=1 Tax=Roseovarius lutimaris TaxID=1005928 RepID=A0A1I5B5N2_9RHOB|nr:DUF2484 family protein [Roseovarius lutimaris]SFN69921.1 Protein of unknown function [Roseovarius lutimaris]